MNNCTLIQGDCLEKMKEIPNNSIDLCLTDPPYGLEFMGKEWDKFSKIESNKKRWEGKRTGKMTENIEFEGTGFKTLPSFNFSNNKKCKICRHYQFSGTPCKCKNPEWEQRENPHLVGYQNFIEQWASAVYPKLKPGAFLVFTMTPRQDLLWRCLAGIEKAGYELKTSGMFWLYHTGFPKALDVSKAIDKQGGKNLSWFIDYIINFAEKKGITKKELTMLFPSKNGNPTGWLWNKQKTQDITLEQFNKIKDFLKLPFETVEECEREIIGESNTTIGIGGASPRMGGKHLITKPINETSKKWQGWKSFQLKPAVECIVVAQKPRSQKTVVGQVLENGCGAVNIGECRIPYEDTKNPATNPLYRKNAGYKNMTYPDFNSTSYKLKKETSERNTNEQGRFPANLIVQGELLVGESKSGTMNCVAGGFGGREVCYGDSNKPKNVYQASSGSPNRFYDIDRWAKKRNITLTQDSAFFDVPKPSKAEKNEGIDTPKHKNIKPKGILYNEEDFKDGLERNTHPTCKPITLFRYLTTLFCQTNGTILDPFMGSGTTGIACLQENKKFIGIEKDPEYYKIAQARIKPFSQQTCL